MDSIYVNRKRFNGVANSDKNPTTSNEGACKKAPIKHVHIKVNEPELKA